MKAKQKPAKQDDPEQSRAFIEKAREIGADERQSSSEELMGRLAKMKPEPHSKKKANATVPKAEPK